MEIREMTAEALEERKAAIATELDNEGADLDALENEVRSINEELEARKAAEAKKNEVRSMVAAGAGEVIAKTPAMEERKGMNFAEIRASKAYEDAFAEYIKTKDATACRNLLAQTTDAEERALLTENGGGTVSVPTIVYDIVKTAWEKDGIASRVHKAYLAGNLDIDFEYSSSDAVVRTEGVAPDEGTIVLGTTSIVPEDITKWISVSKQSATLRGAEFLRFVYDSLVHKVAQKAVNRLIAKIDACGTVATSTCVGVPVVTSTQVSIGLIADAMAKLSDEAVNPVVIMNKSTWGEFKKAQYANKFNTDPFEGLDVLFNNSITAFSAATTGVTYAIVGDLGEGAMFNFPAGEGAGPEVIEDKLTDATAGKVRYIADEYVGIGVIADKAFVKIQH